MNFLCWSLWFMLDGGKEFIFFSYKVISCISASDIVATPSNYLTSIVEVEEPFTPRSLQSKEMNQRQEEEQQQKQQKEGKKKMSMEESILIESTMEQVENAKDDSFQESELVSSTFNFPNSSLSSSSSSSINEDESQIGEASIMLKEYLNQRLEHYSSKREFFGIATKKKKKKKTFSIIGATTLATTPETGSFKQHSKSRPGSKSPTPSPSPENSPLTRMRRIDRSTLSSIIAPSFISSSSCSPSSSSIAAAISTTIIPSSSSCNNSPNSTPNSSVCTMSIRSSSTSDEDENEENEHFEGGEKQEEKNQKDNLTFSKSNLRITSINQFLEMIRDQDIPSPPPSSLSIIPSSPEPNIASRKQVSLSDLFEDNKKSEKKKNKNKEKSNKKQGKTGKKSKRINKNANNTNISLCSKFLKLLISCCSSSHDTNSISISNKDSHSDRDHGKMNEKETINFSSK